MRWLDSTPTPVNMQFVAAARGMWRSFQAGRSRPVATRFAGRLANLGVRAAVRWGDSIIAMFCAADARARAKKCGRERGRGESIRPGRDAPRFSALPRHASCSQAVLGGLLGRVASTGRPGRSSELGCLTSGRHPCTVQPRTTPRTLH